LKHIIPKNDKNRNIPNKAKNGTHKEKHTDLNSANDNNNDKNNSESESESENEDKPLIFYQEPTSFVKRNKKVVVDNFNEQTNENTMSQSNEVESPSELVDDVQVQDDNFLSSSNLEHSEQV